IGITWDASPFGEWRLGRVAASNAATPAPAASVDRIAKSLAAAPSTRVEPAVVRNKTDDPPISVSFENASWPEVAALFARVSGRSIVVGPGVTGQVNAVISNQPWEYVCNAVVASNRYSVSEMTGGIIRIDAPIGLGKREKSDELTTQPR